MFRYPKWYTEYEKEYYDNYIKKVFEFPCTGCKCAGNIKQVGLWKFDCLECGQKMKIDKKKVPRLLVVDTMNPANWRSTCKECGSVSKYHKGPIGGAYICIKCGDVYEV